MRKALLVAACFSAACFLPLQALAIPQVQLTPSLPSPQLTGTAVNLVATGSDTDPGTLTYRYSVSYQGVTRIARDYSQDSSFNWAGTVRDGIHLVRVTVRNNATQQTAQRSLLFRFAPRAIGGQPVVTASANPLVALFSAPACASGSRIRVRFGAPGSRSEVTDWRACDPASSSNVYVAGMRQNTNYSMAAQVRAPGGSTSTGPTLSFMTGSVPSNLPILTQVVGIDPNTSPDNVLVTAAITVGTSSAYPLATDLYGRPIWYYAAFNDPAQAGGLLPRVLPGGTMVVFANGANSADAVTADQVLREIDLAGNALRETNASRVREQLDAMGLVSDCSAGGSFCAFTAFHHDAIRLPNGHTLVLGHSERIYPTGTQGSTEPVNILGDTVVALDENFQVTWYWDSFAHLDVNRAAILGEVCTGPQGGCPELLLDSTANDWLHSNALQYTSDGNLTLSVRHMDWVIKVDYQDGAGDGHVIWRLGAEGDFSLASGDPYPWFSHQHDSGFEADGTLTIFDNGNTRAAANPGVTENSRGQVYQLDEDNLVATLIVNSDLGVYSAALGSAQRLGNGNYHFLAGWNLPGPTQFSQSIETLPDGTTNLRLQSPQLVYRSFRMPSLYAPPGT